MESSLRMKSDSKSGGTDVDLWRGTPVRYLGYANELGESFRPIFPRWVLSSYLISIGYVLCDTWDKGNRAAQDAELRGFSEEAKRQEVMFSATDTLLWQGLASVAIPGITINRIVRMADYGLSRSGSLKHPSLGRWAPTAVGLAMIPLIIKPIDAFVDHLLDRTTRAYWKAKNA